MGGGGRGGAMGCLPAGGGGRGHTDDGDTGASPPPAGVFVQRVDGLRCVCPHPASKQGRRHWGGGAAKGEGGAPHHHGQTEALGGGVPPVGGVWDGPAPAPAPGMAAGVLDPVRTGVPVPTGTARAGGAPPRTGTPRSTHGSPRVGGWRWVSVPPSEASRRGRKAALPDLPRLPGVPVAASAAPPLAAAGPGSVPPWGHRWRGCAGPWGGTEKISPPHHPHEGVPQFGAKP